MFCLGFLVMESEEQNKNKFIITIIFLCKYLGTR